MCDNVQKVSKSNHNPINPFLKINLWRPFRFCVQMLHTFVCFLCSKKLYNSVQIHILFSTKTDILLETYFKVWAKFDNFLLRNKAWSVYRQKWKGLRKWFLAPKASKSENKSQNILTIQLLCTTKILNFIFLIQLRSVF